MKLGMSADGRSLTYDASRYEFQLAKQPVSYDDVAKLEGRNWIRWRAPELREWFAKIDRDAFIANNRLVNGAAVYAPARKLEVRYRSSDPTVATVDAQGRVVIRAEGTTDILAARLDDPAFSSAVKLVTIVSGRSEQASEVRKSFKGKGGKLAKDKSFKLPPLPSGAIGYEKAAGSECVSISKSGKATVKKGTKRGLYSAEVVVRGCDKNTTATPTVFVTIEVK